MYTVIESNQFADWIEHLSDKAAKQRILKTITRIARKGLFPSDVKPVGRGVFELRFHQGPGYRIYFARRGKHIVILLVGGDKSTQRRDITKAQEIWRSWKEQHDRFQAI